MEAERGRKNYRKRKTGGTIRRERQEKREPVIGASFPGDSGVCFHISQFFGKPRAGQWGCVGAPVPLGTQPPAPPSTGPPVSQQHLQATVVFHISTFTSFWSSFCGFCASVPFPLGLLGAVLDYDPGKKLN